MKVIPLSKGYVTVVDDADYEDLCRYRWHASVNRDGTVYAHTTFYADGHYHSLLMHRYLLQLPKGLTVDHKDLDTLNNQRDNLRFATMQEQSRHRAKSRKPRRGRVTYASRYKGVYQVVTKDGVRWSVRLFVGQRRSRRFGVYATQEEAAAAYNQAARDLFGPFAVLNDLTATLSV